MHIMIDLETMGTRPTAPIMSIGAVAFDATGIHDKFYANVDLKSAVNSGAAIDPSTVMWWMSQSDESRAALLDKDDQYAIVGALSALSAWRDWGKVVGVWGNGATFDNVILRETYYRAAVPCPWPFWNDKCYRTVKGIYPDVELVRVGTLHNALADARTQAEHLIAINADAAGIIL
jgi:hypothetical protein